MKVVEKSLQAAGIRTDVSIRDGKELPLICINPLSRKLFDKLFDCPELGNRKIITYDLPGRMGSARPGDPETIYSMKGYSLHLDALLDGLDIKRCALFGLSLGGHIALDYMAQRNPGRTAGIISYGSPPLRDRSDFSKAFLPAEGGASLFQGAISPEEAVNIVRPMTADPREQEAAVEAVLDSDPFSRTWLVESFSREEFFNECSYVLSTSKPVLLCYGKKEKTVSLPYLEEVGIMQQRSEILRLLEDQSHFPDLSPGSLFIRHLADFLEGIDAEPGLD